MPLPLLLLQPREKMEPRPREPQKLFFKMGAGRPSANRAATSCTAAVRPLVSENSDHACLCVCVCMQVVRALPFKK